MSRGWAATAGAVHKFQNEGPALAAAMASAVAAQTSPSTSLKGLPAVVGAQRLIASTIDQLAITTTSGQVPRWLRKPRSYGAVLDQGDLVQWLVTSMLWHGAGYLAATRVGESWRLDAVHPDQVTVHVTHQPLLRLDYRLAGQPIDRAPASPLDAVQNKRYLLPIPLTVTPDHPEGVSPLQQARTSLEGFTETERQSWQTLTDGTHSGGRLETDQELAPATARRYRDAWVEARNPADGQRKIPVLGSGLQYVNDLINPRDAQWIEARAFNQAVVYMMLGIPPDYMGASLVGGQSSMAYANSQDNNRRFRRNCLEGYTTQLADALTTLLPPGRNPDEADEVMFDYTDWEGQTTDE